MAPDRPATAVVTLVLASVVHLGPGTAATAGAQQGWATPVDTLSALAATGGSLYGPRVAVDSAGNAVAVWLLTVGPGQLLVQASRRATSDGAWSPPTTLAGPGAIQPGALPDVAIDADGDALAIWTFGTFPFYTVFTARYSATTGGWAAAEPRSSGQAGAFAALAMNDGGDALATWVEPAGVVASRFDGGAGTWGAAQPVSADTPVVVAVATDLAGNGVAVWQTAVNTPVRAARFTASSSTWGAAADVSAAIPGPGLGGATVAMNDAGMAVAAWSRGGLVETAVLPPGAAPWGAPETVSSGGALFEDMARVAVDPGGNVLALWLRTTGATRVVQTARRASSTGLWTSPETIGAPSAQGPASLTVDRFGNAFAVWSTSAPGSGLRLGAARYGADPGVWTFTPDLSAAGQAAWNSDVAVDDAGNAVVVWFQTAGGLSVNQSRRWLAALDGPVISGVTPSPGALSVALEVPGSDPTLAATTFEVSLDGGVTWTPRTPAGVDSPLAVTGLTDGVTYDLRLRAVNVAGPGLASPALPVRSGVGSTPTDLRVVGRTGNTVTFAWVAPPAGIVPDGYLIEGRISGHAQVLASLPTGGTATQLTLAVPNGTFDVWVVATYGGRRLGQSAPLPIAVNTAAFPSAPVNLLASAAGDTLALSWTNTWSGATLTGLQLLVGGTVTASVTLPVTESFTYAGVPPGTYTFAVTALNGTAPGGATSSVQVTFPGTCTGPPAPPAAFSLTTQGGRVFLDWLPPPSGAAVTSYVLAVSGAFNGALPTSTRSLAVPVGPGSYSVRVASVGPCGTSAFTSPQTVVVP